MCRANLGEGTVFHRPASNQSIIQEIIFYVNAIIVFYPVWGCFWLRWDMLFYASVKKLGWKYIGLGALAWVITVALKFCVGSALQHADL